jgi:hypothetical protein
MLRQEAYEKVSEVFGTIVGVASIIKVMEASEVEKAQTPVEFKKSSDEIDVNMIITKAIDNGKYKELQKNLYTLNRKRHPRAKDLTIYKRAWDNIKDNGKRIF